ncbi:hypothetical protein [Actinomadura sp. 21ATH]|uniref:hypothetical protein n=1 Tax=Actinomadura sp. 21ATH TaxID=1735444 RepID=UPI0035BF7478
MPETPPVPPPPAPEGAASWTEYTAALRALYAWCGSPKYRALCGRTPGLSPAAVSTLIGRNPLTRPPETATARFTEACLRYGAHPDVEIEQARWTAQWKTLNRPDSADAAEHHAGTPEDQTQSADATPGETQRTGADPGEAQCTDVEPGGAQGTGTEPGEVEGAGAEPEVRGAGADEEGRGEDEGTARPAVPAGRSAGRRVALGGVVGLTAAALAGGVVAFVAAPGEPAPGPAAGCRHLRGTIEDVRTGRTWAHLFQCPNVPGTDVYLEARAGDRVGFLDTDPSWFVCWVRGGRHRGGNDVWYYTQGDRPSGRAGLKAWGYVPASALHVARHPDPAITEECPF